MKIKGLETKFVTTELLLTNQEYRVKPVLLVHPFSKFDFRCANLCGLNLKDECHGKYFENLGELLFSHNGPIITLDAQINMEITREIFREIRGSHSNSLSFIGTELSMSPVPVKGWNYLFSCLKDLRTNKVVIGGRYFNFDDIQRQVGGCIGVTMNKLFDEGYQPEVISD